MKNYENVPMKSSVPKKFGWILNRTRLLKKYIVRTVCLFPRGWGGRGGQLEHKIDEKL